MFLDRSVGRMAIPKSRRAIGNPEGQLTVGTRRSFRPKPSKVRGAAPRSIDIKKVRIGMLSEELNHVLPFADMIRGSVARVWIAKEAVSCPVTVCMRLSRRL